MTVSIEQAQLKLAELIDKSAGGERVVITRDGLPVAQIVARVPRQPGFAKDILEIISDDDEHLKDFAEYTE